MSPTTYPARNQPGTPVASGRSKLCAALARMPYGGNILRLAVGPYWLLAAQGMLTCIPPHPEINIQPHPGYSIQPYPKISIPQQTQKSASIHFARVLVVNSTEEQRLTR